MKRISLTLEWLVILGIVMVLGALLSGQIARNLLETQSIVSGLKDTDQKLQRLQMLVDTIPGGVCVVDESGTMIYVNQGLESLSLYSPKELLGYSFIKLMPEEYRADHIEKINNPAFAASEEGASRCIPEGKLLRSDGRIVTLTVQIQRHRVNGSYEWMVFFDPTSITNGVDDAASERQEP